ncbi:IS66 family transposase [Lacrimispora sp.]|jgi:transposase|uniref:IS66 family transposase n=1 Tax=Lacrimispora sp. TaxID=2719234 RepID=UPI0029E01C30|nr:transposase [Lacrimispora sp.]
MDEKSTFEQQMKLLQTVIEQQQAYIQAQNAHMAEKDARMAEKDETITQLRRLVDDLQSLKANLEETLKELRRQLFGTSSEKTASEEKNTQEITAVETKAKITVKEHTRERKPKAKRDDIYAGLPIREVKIPLTDDQRRCEYCNSEMITIGYTQVREEIRITPAKVERIRLMQEVAICPECKKDGDGTIVKAKVYPALLPHSPASASSVAYVIFEKTFMGMPYYRQESGMAEFGFKLPRETMANWFIYCAEHYFYPIYERMHEYLTKREILHADETTCQVLREDGRSAESTSYMWIYLTGSDGLPPIVLYDYEAGRSGKYARDFLEGFTGLLQCDGYQGYNKVEDVILVGCLAHCRRKFYEAIPAGRRKAIKLLDINSKTRMEDPVIPDENEQEKLIPAEIGLSYCNKLFYIERELKNLPADERKAKREEKETAVWTGFWKWINSIQALGGSKLEKAVNYALNHQETLCNYMKDGRCEISNNAAERRAKSYAIGRKAFLFHTSVAGANASAVMYSMIETAKANNLSVFQYLYMVLLYMPDYKNEPAGIEKLLPWSDFMKEHCTGLIDVENITAEKHEPLPI